MDQRNVMRVYMIWDRLAEEAGPVFESVNNLTALRGYHKMLSRQGDKPDEYKLLWIGEIDHKSCKAVILDEPVEVVRGGE